ncbi:MAG: hypothetical protein RBS01_01105 [Candidatus Dojkabacteria bacterium]|nr:hypothetical protein [Candidatus Dojkabacteria bacterium]
MNRYIVGYFTTSSIYYISQILHIVGNNSYFSNYRSLTDTISCDTLDY